MVLSKFVTTPEPTSFLVSQILQNCSEKVFLESFVGGLHPLSVELLLLLSVLLNS